jgi:hypothetical protein
LCGLYFYFLKLFIFLVLGLQNTSAFPALELLQITPQTRKHRQNVYYIIVGNSSIMFPNPELGYLINFPELHSSEHFSYSQNEVTDFQAKPKTFSTRF